MAIGFESGFGQANESNFSTIRSNVDGIVQNVNYEHVSQLVDKHIAEDGNFLQLHDLLKANADAPTVSGLADTDYPNLAEISSTVKSRTNLQRLKTIQLPADLVEQFGHAQQNFEMGLFPELHRAWLTIDANFYMWAYDNSNDLSYYDGVTEPIIGVALVKPRSGVFREYIKYLLVLTTSVEIVAIGLTCEMEGTEVSNVLSLPEPFLVLPTDNIVMNVVCGTDTGRIFIGAKDGCLYEIQYQTEQTWFKRKCAKINHSKSTFSFLIPSLFNFAEADPIVQIEVDNSRNILFTRSEGGTIDVYDLGNNGDQMYRCASKTLQALATAASNVVKTIDSKNFRPIIHIGAIDKTESSFINLVAVTQTGIRLYLTCSNNMRCDTRPRTLRLVHVRLPPGYTASSSSQRASNVKIAYHRRANTIFISQNDGRDIMWTLSNDPFPFESQLIELFSAIPVQNKIWKMSEELRPRIVANRAITASSSSTNNLSSTSYCNDLQLPELIAQEMEERRKFVFLTSNGVHICEKPRPVDHFRQLLEDHKGFDNDAIKGFFLLYKEAQACAIALNIACSPSIQDKILAEWARLAFFKYGGESQLTYHATNQTDINAYQNQKHGSSTHQVSTPIQNFNRSLTLAQSPIQPLQSFLVSSPFLSPTAGSPVNASFNSVQQQKPTNMEPAVQYSSKHTGLYLYFSRLIRPIWKSAVVQSKQDVLANREVLSSSLTSKEIALYLEKLQALKEFLVKNIQFTSTDVPSNYSFMNQLPAQVFTAQAYEKSSFYNLLQLISRCLEILGLWKLLNEHDFASVANCLSKEGASQLKAFSFRDLVVSGCDLCGLLASLLVQKYIEDNATTDAICRTLNDACPSIFRQENALLAKAHEILTRAKNVNQKQEANHLIAQAVTIFKNIGARINLEKACQLLEGLHAFKEIVDLVIFVSSARDKDNLAHHFYRNGEPLEDKVGRSAFAMRIETYRILLDVYERLIAQSKSVITSGSMDTSMGSISGSPTLNRSLHSLYPESLNRDQAKNFAEVVLNQVIASTDELLHNVFYDWLFEHQQREHLLQVKSPYFENYLKRKAETNGNSNLVLDLLWMYYEINGNYRGAAHILDKLSESHGSEVDLSKRFEYLSRAIMCMRSCPSHVAKMTESDDGKTYGEFLHELEEKMEVAEIQAQILEQLQRMTDNPQAQMAIPKLNSDLLGVTELYSEYADKFDLPECQLAIMFSAGHFDPLLVEGFWQRIFDKQYEELGDKSDHVQKLVLSNKLEQLVRIYVNSEKFFPIDFIVRYLESKVNTQTEYEWLAKKLLSLDLTLSNVLEIYHKLYKSKALKQNWPEKNFQLLFVICYLLTCFIEQPILIPSNQRAFFNMKCLDVISGYLIDLQEFSTFQVAQNLMSELRSLQQKYEKNSL